MLDKNLESVIKQAYQMPKPLLVKLNQTMGPRNSNQAKAPPSL